ncbi:Amino acid permease 6 [Heracleum sosnowskyi]|uniref:Amino acid permease 6 n=1 Tax=Heracleum sosnowskyi TaxID=360622 RepID=A0AAD8JCU8_9APIA|nr:Amino acid permease 6 [Heracleum sosnowskyi]
MSFSVERGSAYNEIYNDEIFDEDGRPKRTGTLLTAVAHMITSVVGSGVLSLAWAVAQLGWIAGTSSLIIFSLITLFTSHLLADCYRSPQTGRRNYCYIEAVKSSLGGLQVQLCGIAQCSLLVGISIGYIFVTSSSIVAINCGAKPECHISSNKFMIIYGTVQIVLSQIPNFHKLSFLSITAATMSFTYSSIGIALSFTKLVQGNGHSESMLTGVPIGWTGVTREDKIWNILSAMGDIAFAYSFSSVLTNIQDTIKSSPQEKKVMKNAISISIVATTVFYLLFGLIGYAAFGSGAPGNFLAEFGSFKPCWIVDFANTCLTVHLFGAYQVACQPVYRFVESWSSKKWPENEFITKEYTIIDGCYDLNFFRLVWRTIYVIVTTVLALLFPFFNHFVGLLGAITFWPITVYFPIQMYIAQWKIARFSRRWNGLQLLSLFCLIVSLLVTLGSLRGIVISEQKVVPLDHIS